MIVYEPQIFENYEICKIIGQGGVAIRVVSVLATDKS